MNEKKIHRVIACTKTIHLLHVHSLSLHILRVIHQTLCSCSHHGMQNIGSLQCRKVVMMWLLLVLASPSASGGAMPGEEEADTRPSTGGCSIGLTAARPPLLAACGWLRSEETTCMALSKIQQVVRLSHNFIVHFSPTAGHGARQRPTRHGWTVGGAAAEEPLLRSSQLLHDHYGIWMHAPAGTREQTRTI